MRRPKGAIALALALALVGVAGCGDNSLSKEAEEGVPIELSDMEFNVQLTRYLNPTDPEDAAYLAGQKLPPPAGQSYLAVFMTIDNKGEATHIPEAAEMSVVDTTGVAYEALPSSTDYAVPLGEEISDGGEIPEAGTPAASGPTQGSIVLFLTAASAPENRPLKLEIEREGETGEITLDI